MSTCDVCGNQYDRTFEVRMDGHSYTFDSFECAIHRLAPSCGHCRVQVVGHGVQAGDQVFCCVSCAVSEGAKGLRDHVPG
ncbi:hypothetical protein [Marinactinospora rubrisoli]|uniref:Prokaryotic metallothionein n=1 Tax=Marinactinospora rubrisoli TaxID=2715399 RepID=A0ABW2KFB8_9ACTN